MRRFLAEIEFKKCENHLHGLMLLITTLLYIEYILRKYPLTH